MESATADGPLHGLHVLDLTRFPPGGYCTVMLADLGADVCRIESPGTRSPMGWVGLNRGKRSIGVDLRHPRGVEVLRRLAAWADVLVENERPGAMDERGFGYSHAATETPALVWCSISGYGQEGPYARWSGHDLSYAAHSGLLAAVDPGFPWHPESMLSIPGGALMAVIGILAALRERDRTGRGCQLDISISEAATWQLSAIDGEINGQHHSIPAGADRRLYECADGKWVAVAAAEPRTWAALCDGLGLADLKESLHRWEDPDAVIARVAAVFKTRSAAEWVAELGPKGAAVVRANRGAEVQEDPQIQARGTLQRVGDVLVPASPVRMRGPEGARPAPTSFPPPEAGADTEAVLAEAGLSVHEISDFRESGVLGSS
jgi:crotonobetainyl-CoA:carnitine CoA-transferase CaiB-like acyl-CoA transferase